MEELKFQMMGFLMGFFYLYKYPQKYVLSPWLYKMHHYFRVACVTGNSVARVVACCLESRFSLSARGFSVMVAHYVVFWKPSA